MYGYLMGPPVIQTTDMDSLMDSKEWREDGYTTEDDINLNAFFNEGPDLKIVDHIENNNHEDTHDNHLIIHPDQQVKIFDQQDF